MKKVLTAIAALMICVGMNAQTWSVSAGYSRLINKEKVTVVGPSSVTSTDSRSGNGFFVGANCEFPSDKVVSFYPGLRFSGEFVTDDDYADTKASLYAIEVPLNAKFSFNLGSAAKLFVYVGPQLELGLSAKSKVGSATIDLYKDDSGSHLNRFVLNANAGLGFQFSNFRVFGEYARNLTKVVHTPQLVGAETKYSMQNINIGVAYVF